LLVRLVAQAGQAQQGFALADAAAQKLLQHVALHAFLRLADRLFLGHFQRAHRRAVPREGDVQLVIRFIAAEDQREKAAAHLARHDRRDQPPQPHVRQRHRDRVRADLGHFHPVAEQGRQRVGVVERVLDDGPVVGPGQRASHRQRAEPFVLHDDRLSDHLSQHIRQRLEAAVLGRKLQELLADFAAPLVRRQGGAHQQLGDLAFQVAQDGRVREAQQRDGGLVGGVLRRLADLADDANRRDVHLGQVAHQPHQGQLVAEQVHGVQRQQRQLPAAQIGKGRGARVQDVDPRHRAVERWLASDDRRANRQRQAEQVIDRDLDGCLHRCPRWISPTACV